MLPPLRPSVSTPSPIPAGSRSSPARVPSPALIAAEQLLFRGKAREAAEALAPIIAEQPSSVRARLRLAEAHFHQGNATEAQETALSALEIDPHNLRCWLIIARAAHQLGEGPAASEAFANAVERAHSPHLRGQVLYEWARVEVEFGNVEVARVIRERAVATGAQPPVKFAERIASAQLTREAVVARKTRDFERARRLLESAREANPNDPVIHTELAQVDIGEAAIDLRRRAALRASAQAHLERALELAPKDVVIHTSRANLARLRHDYAEAIRIYDHVLSIDPSRLQARSGKAQALLDAGEIDAARTIYEGIVRDHPKDIQAHVGLGDCARAQNRIGEAQRRYYAALACDAGNSKTLTRLGTVVGMSDLRRGLMHLKDAYRLGAHPSPLLHAAEICLRHGREEQARSKLVDIISYEPWARHPDYVVALERLGEIEMRAGRYTFADQYFAREADYLPRKLLIKHHRAKIAIAENRLDDAHKQLEEALGVMPNDVVALTGMANVAHLRGDNLQAEGWIARALAHHPENVIAQCLSVEIAAANQWTDEARRRLDLAVRLAPEHAAVVALSERFGSPEAPARGLAATLWNLLHGLSWKSESQPLRPTD